MEIITIETTTYSGADTYTYLSTHIDDFESVKAVIYYGESNPRRNNTLMCVYLAKPMSDGINHAAHRYNLESDTVVSFTLETSTVVLTSGDKYLVVR